MLDTPLWGEVTVLLADSEVIRTSMDRLYALARTFSPSLVILEEIDLVGSRRGTDNSVALVDFLTSLDGIMNDHSGVLTRATTNSVGGLDAAVVCAARCRPIRPDR